MESRFGVALREERTRLKLSQKAMAERLAAAGFSIDGPGLSRLEKGNRSVRLGEAQTIAEVLAVPLDYLVGTSTKLELSTARKNARQALDSSREQLTNVIVASMQVQRMLKRDPSLLPDLASLDDADDYPKTADEYLTWVADRVADPLGAYARVSFSDAAMYTTAREILRSIADSAVRYAPDGPHEQIVYTSEDESGGSDT